MLSCSNSTNVSCLNGGQCETYYNAIDLPFSSAMLEDTLTARVVYIIVLICLVVIGLMNNIAGLMTFIRENIRITACGVYLIVFSSCTILRMIVLQISILTVAAYDTPSFRLWSCYASPYVSLTMGFTGVWITVGIAAERVLIECFNMNLYGTRGHAILWSIGFFIYSAIANLPAIFVRKYALNPSGHSICVYDYISYPGWKQVDTVFFYIYVIVPCTLHLVCSACILTVIARRKILIHRNSHPEQRLYYVWFQQLYIHRDFLVPPLFLITCLLPNAIHDHLIVKCVPHSSLQDLRLHIVFIFLLHIPSVFICVVYIYPNDSYRKEFRQTCFYRRYKQAVQRRYQLPVTKPMTLEQLVENSRL